MTAPLGGNFGARFAGDARSARNFRRSDRATRRQFTGRTLKEGGRSFGIVKRRINAGTFTDADVKVPDALQSFRDHRFRRNVMDKRHRKAIKEYRNSTHREGPYHNRLAGKGFSITDYRYVNWSTLKRELTANIHTGSTKAYNINFSFALLLIHNESEEHKIFYPGYEGSAVSNLFAHPDHTIFRFWGEERPAWTTTEIDSQRLLQSNTFPC